MVLESGQAVRYRGIGCGSITDITERKFKGEVRKFASIYFPHRDMTAQIPIDDATVADKLSAAMNERKLRKLLKDITGIGAQLPRTWDQREEMGSSMLRDGGPQQWAELLASYALADGAGVSVAASDAELVREAQELLAAELCSVNGGDYAASMAHVERAYANAAKPRKKGEAGAEHYAAVELLA